MLLRCASRRQLSPVVSPLAWRVFHLAARNADIEHRHPAFEDFATDLRSLPAFWTRGKDVKVLYQPKEFYAALLNRIAGAKRRIFIASLYVGKGETDLIEALRTALLRNSELKVVFLFDYLRSTRETPRPSSASLVATLSAAFPSQVELRLWHTPDLTGWTKRLVPRRFDEGWGLQHMKCYGFDDDVIMSGANLSGDYFTNRQDRYIHFLSHPPLADYFHSLIQAISKYSFLVSATDTTTDNPALQIIWPSSNSVPSPLASSTSIPDFKQHAGDTLRSLTDSWALKKPEQLRSTLPSSLNEPRIFDTILRPVLQMGPLAIRQETELVVPAIFKTGNYLATAPGGFNTTIDWTSGYFSVQPAYREHVLNSRALVRIVTASPEANGFLNSRGVSKYIPPAYTYLTHEFYKEAVRQAKTRGRESHIDIREWARESWTYHAKGIWLTPALSSVMRTRLDASPLTDPDDRDDEIKLNHPRAPYLTMIGSSNYGLRSATRDLEANVLVTTLSTPLRAHLHEEILQLRHFATDVVGEEMFARKDRVVPWGVKVAARAIETML